MTIRRKVTREQIRNEPHVLWNEYVHLLAMGDYDDLTDIQRIPHLAFWYEHEIQNGGHLQYFENRGTGRLHEVLAALQMLGARCQSEILERAGKLWLATPRPKFESVEAYIEAALEGAFTRLDRAYYACRPEMPEFLRAFLETQEAAFIEIVE